MPPPAAEAATLALDTPSAATRAFPPSRLAAALYFLTDGMVFGTWAALIPTFKSRFSLTEPQLSLVLLGIAAGSIISMPLSGHTVARYGSRPNLRLYALGFCLALILLVLAPSFPLLIAAAFLFGAFKGAFNVSVNTQAITIENTLRRPVISSFHALWSFGGMLAAFIAGAALKAQLSPLAIVLFTSVTLAIATLAVSAHLLPGDAAPRTSSKPRFRLPGGKLLRIGTVTFMVLFAEGVMMDWSVVYTRTVSHAETWLAPFAFGIFSGCMATGRIFGGTLITRLGPSNLLRFGSLTTAIGLGIVTTIHTWPATFAGLALAGFGLSNLIPILFGAGGRADGNNPSNGIATVSMMGYFGFLIGPPVIGFLSHEIGLPGAFALVVAFAAFIAIFSNRFLGKIQGTSQP